MKVTLIQSEIIWEDVLNNLSHFEKLIKNSEFTDLIVLPEMFTTGFTVTPSKLNQNYEMTLDWMKTIAIEKNCAIIGSSVARESGCFYNRLFFVQPNGLVTHYDKRHLFGFSGEDKEFTRGDRLLIQGYNGWRICPLICYDLRFPVWSRNTSNYDLLIFVANWPKARAYEWEQLLIARAIENQSYVIGVNRIGIDDNGLEYSGNSLLINPLGIKQLDLESLSGCYSELIDLEYQSNIRQQRPFLRDQDSFTLINNK